MKDNEISSPELLHEIFVSHSQRGMSATRTLTGRLNFCFQLMKISLITGLLHRSNVNALIFCCLKMLIDLVDYVENMVVDILYIHRV